MRLKEYYRLIDVTDRAVVRFRDSPDSIVINKGPRLDNFKKLLKRNVRPESPRKFLFEKNVVLYSYGRKLGSLIVSDDEKAYVNFHSDSVNLTFQLTYGLGTALSEMSYKNSR